MRSSSLVPSPLGELLLVADAGALVGLWLPTGRDRPDPDCLVPDDDAEPLPGARAQLAAYFAGELTTFELRLAPVGSDFCRRVWTAVAAIPFGVTVGYGALAGRLGMPRSARAVGSANARNPISIVIGCHRLVGADGSLTGYGGGLPAKRWLLAHEARVSVSSTPPLSPS